MGLDVYVGSLTRYYARNWETIVQQAARSQGIQVQVMRPNPLPDDQIKNPAQIRDLVIEWRSKMQAELKGAELIDADLDWPEQPETPYFTDKPDWECFGAMTLLAAYEEEPKPIFGSRWPKTLKDSWARDPKLEARLKAKTGLGIFLNLTRLAVEHHLPMLLDY